MRVIINNVSTWNKWKIPIQQYLLSFFTKTSLAGQIKIFFQGMFKAITQSCSLSLLSEQIKDSKRYYLNTTPNHVAPILLNFSWHIQSHPLHFQIAILYNIKFAYVHHRFIVIIYRIPNSCDNKYHLEICLIFIPDTFLTFLFS